MVIGSSVSGDHSYKFLPETVTVWMHLYRYYLELVGEHIVLLV
jgi:hypothetical protein